MLQRTPVEICADVKGIATLCCKADTLNSAAFNVNGAAEQGTDTTK